MPDSDRLLNAIDAAEAQSYGSDADGQLASERSRAIDYYFGQNVDPAPDGRSQVVDRSTFETIQWMLPSLCRIFANGDDVVEFVPLGPDDEESARQESDYLNYLVTQKNRWFDTCLTWFQDALLTKNAYCMAYMDESVKTERERYEGQTREALELLLEDSELIEHEAFPDPEGQMEQQGVDELGQPIIAPRMLYNVEIRRSQPQKRLCFKVLPPERCKVSEYTPSHTLESCDYFEYCERKSISELRAMGFDVDDDIGVDDEDDAEEDEARDVYHEREGDEETPVDPAMRRVRVRAIWIRHDYNEDGIAELLYVIRVAREILHQEECSRIPVSCIVPYPNTHRHIGLSVADIVADIQRIKTTILRSGLDNLYLTNNARTAISDKVDIDDLLVNRPGGIVRVNEGALPANEIMPLLTPFVFDKAMMGLEYMDQVRENRTGTNRYFTGIDQNALNKTATGIQQLSTMAAQRVEQIARIFAAGVQHLFGLAHELVLKHGHQAEVVKLRGRWVQVDPKTWKTGRDLRIVVGYGAGNKDALVSRLMLILQAQEKALAIGVATPQNIYEALVELTKASDFSTPERFWTNPAQNPPPPPAPDPQIQAEQIKAQTQVQIKAAEIQEEARQADQKIVLEKYRVDQDTHTKLAIASLNAQVKKDSDERRSREARRESGKSTD